MKVQKNSTAKSKKNFTFLPFSYLSVFSRSPETILSSFLLITIVFISKQSGDDSQGRLAKISPGNNIAAFNNSFSRVPHESENKQKKGRKDKSLSLDSLDQQIYTI